mgnify:CR=1 FL=1
MKAQGAMEAGAPLQPTPHGACPPASTLGVSSAPTAKRGTTLAGFSRGPTRPSGRSPHSSKEGMCSANSSLFEQRYNKQLFPGMSSGNGTPAKTSSTAYHVSGGSPDS